MGFQKMTFLKDQINEFIIDLSLRAIDVLRDFILEKIIREA